MATVKGHGPKRGVRRGAVDGGKIWWVAPSYPVASEIWRDLKRAAGQAYDEKSEVERRIELPGGGSVTVKSADNPDSLRGSGLDGLVVDEAGSVKAEAWREALRPSLSDRLGWAVFIGSPKGSNWFRDLFDFAEKQPDWERWQRPTADNPIVLPSEIAAAEREMLPSLFSQEYGAQFIGSIGDLFPRDKAVVVDAAPANVAVPVRYWDKAGSEREQGDFAVGSLIARVDHLTYVLDVVRGKWNPFARNKVIADTAAMDRLRFHGKMQLWIEQEPGNGGKESAMISAKELAAFAPRFEVPSRDKVTRSQNFAAQWCAGNVRLVRGAWNSAYIDELAAFPNGLHDDQVDASSGAFNKLLTGVSQQPAASLPSSFTGSIRR